MTKSMTRVIFPYAMSIDTGIPDEMQDPVLTSVTMQFTVPVNEEVGDIAEYFRSNLGKPIEMTLEILEEVNNE